MVTVKDEEVRPLSFSDAVLKVVKPTAPFQIERTPKEFRQLETALNKWSETHGNNSPPCQFCAPFVRAESAKGLVGLLTSPFKPKKTLQQWEDWLSTAIQHVRSVDLATASPCAGVRHIPSLLARFLLQEFASDVIF
ncbi:hypothetical protein P43SY_010403 [Pythium insidiosum]|uniref:Uncharacterized protein n=1 Tax=Pythium insidiosum TaxID=114742 RepID=A0AAD5L8V0_PYTIN|nr:hypothetical protein P43SY_010403 [Pythium insidiosum]